MSDTLQRWLDEEKAVLDAMAKGPGAGVSTPDQIAGKSGLELMQAMLRGELPFPPIAPTLDFTLVAVGDGTATFQGTPLPRHLNPLGTIHGGWFATLLDSALGCAVHTKMPPGRAYTTAELGVNLVKALTQACVDTIGSKPESVDILLFDIRPSDWATGGELWSEKKKAG